MSTKKLQVFTIPNILSMIRILLVPLIVYLYTFREEYIAAVIVLTVSSVTDVLDGIIARHFRMTSEFGKFIDPIADKLTQLAALVCLSLRFDLILLLVGVLLLKEGILAIFSFLVLRKTGSVHVANRYGKASTVVLYLTVAVHMFWPTIPFPVSLAIVSFCICVMLIAFVSYLLLHLATLGKKFLTTKKEG